MKLIILAGNSPKIQKHPRQLANRISRFLNQGFTPKDIVIATDTTTLPLIKTLLPEANFSVEDQPLHTAGAVKNAQNFYLSDPEVMIANGDTNINTSLQSFIDFHHHSQSSLTILLKKANDVSQYGHVSLNLNHQIERYHEKLTHLHTPGLVNGGLYLINTQHIFNLANHIPISLEKEVFPNIISLNQPIFGYIP
jgi:NDP-sugar pyrophosphorylase family protein